MQPRQSSDPAASPALHQKPRDKSTLVGRYVQLKYSPLLSQSHSHVAIGNVHASGKGVTLKYALLL